MIKTLTNQITYNRLLRSTAQILMENVFEHNDNFTRNTIHQKLRALYSKAKQSAITEYKIEIKDYDPKNPHYMEVLITIKLPNMIHYVIINMNNVDFF